MTFIDELKDSEGFRGMPYDGPSRQPDHWLRHAASHLTCGGRAAAEAPPRGLDRAARQGPPGARHRARHTSRWCLAGAPRHAYNMGVPRLMGFKRMLAAVERGDWPRAKVEALDSKWAEQVPNRAAKVVRGFEVSSSSS